MPVTLDTLNIYNRLKATGLSEESAKAIAEILREAIEENLASKNDLRTTEGNLTKYIETVRAQLEKSIETLRAELEKSIETLRSELKKDIEVLRSEVKTQIAESKVSTIKWVAGMLVAQAGLIATLVKLL
ncbi:MAG: DUF1640 domain-containing protein [Deltaproteobacteria bacterium]|nr:DUF1640 domain-containing protein [Deltaproteobacteria bacterium]MBW2342028.1 DUF1640 domain-containing protein [Deltaproteobacteria bacterium]